MVKDRYQKQKLLQYFLSKSWYPQLEVDVIYNESTSQKPKMITDIDVLSLAPNDSGVFQPVIGDCKTLKNQSPINRVFWIKGLMSYFSANYGIVLLAKKIEGEHQLLANELGVSLFSDDDFKTYSSATSSLDEVRASAIGKIENWDKYFDLPNHIPNLSTLYSYCKSGFWNERDYNIKLRHSIARLRSVRHELNPDNNLSLFLFLELASQFAIAINELAIKIFNKYLWPANKDIFDKELKVHLWGGYENYSFWNELRSRLTATSTNDGNELSLPEWKIFVNLARSSLEKPLSTTLTPIILKEIAFCFLDGQETLDKWDYLGTLVKKDLYSAKLAIQIIDYLVKAARLPQEFSENPVAIIMKLQRP